MHRSAVDRSKIIEEVLESSGLGMVAVDQSGAVLCCNEAAARILGLGAEQIAPQDWPEHFGICAPDDIGMTIVSESPIARALAGEQAENIEVLIQNRLGPGRTLWCTINFKPLRDQHKQIFAALMIIQDVTKRRELSDELTRSNLALQQFATVAAHDLQEPLRSISGFADMLAQYQHGQLDEKSQRCVSKIKEGILRMQTLISDLLSYSRIQTKPQLLKPVKSEQILLSCISALNASIGASGTQVTFDALPEVTADASQLSQLFQNLIGNALKFVDADRTPSIHISARRKGLNWLFSVADNGIGIAPEFRERIFGVFQRLHNRTAYPGNGIGLAICQMIVQRHGGKIWVESELAKGSTFYFTIPADTKDDK